MSSDSSKRYLLFENPNGNIPKKLRKLCSGMEELFENAASTSSKPVLGADDIGSLEAAIDRTSNVELRKLTLLDKFWSLDHENLFLLKVKTQSNPRLYFTDLLSGYLVFLHGLKKQTFDEDSADVDLAVKRLELIQSGEAMPRWSES